MEKYPIPQFIEEEGKIISFLTFKQFFWLVGGLGASMLLYFIVPLIPFAVASIIILASVAIIAFVKVNNQSILKAVLTMFGFMVKSKNYTWQKKEAPYPFKIEKSQEPAADQAAPTLRVQNSKLRDAKKIVELIKK